MQSTRIAPNRTGLSRPMHTCNTVVVASNQSQDVFTNHLVFVRIDVVDARDVQSDSREERFPSCHGVGADDGMDRGEFVADVQGGAARGHEFVAAGFRGRAEHGLGACRGEGLEKGFEWWGEAVVAGSETKEG